MKEFRVSGVAWCRIVFVIYFFEGTNEGGFEKAVGVELGWEELILGSYRVKFIL